MIVILICLALLGALALISPRLAVLYVFFSFSFEQLLRTRQPDVVGAVNASGLPPIRFSQFVTLVLLLGLSARYLIRLRMPKPTGLFWLLVLYVGVNFASLNYSLAPSDSLRQLTIIFMILVTVVTFNLIFKSEELVQRAIYVMYWGAVAHFLWALLQLFLYLTGIIATIPLPYIQDTDRILFAGYWRAS
jgi:hypothetical protein